MGVYVNRGFEYRIELCDGTSITVIPMVDLDDRMRETSYFEKRNHIWFDPIIRCLKLSLSDYCSVIFTDSENDKIDELLWQNSDTVKAYGIYDVSYVNCTL